MKTYFPGNPLIMKILGSQKGNPDDCSHLSAYTVSESVDGGTLFYNSLTQEMIWEADSLLQTDSFRGYLYQHRFLVPDSLEESRLVSQLRELLPVFQRPSGSQCYTIMTTLDCNARCYYCYELGRARVRMTEDTARQIAAYIADHAGGNKIVLRWFGGEPLYNSSVISVICSVLSGRGISYESELISNGYLLSGEVLETAVDLWHLKKAQITFDGTAPVYNRIKNYIHADPNPFQTVLNNVKAALSKNIRISVRLNVSEENLADQFELTKFLLKELPEERNCLIYPRMLFEYAGNKISVRSKEARRKLTSGLIELMTLIAGHGRLDGIPLQKSDLTSSCIADSDSALVITPDGNVGKCEHYSESEFIGTIADGVWDEQAVAAWKAPAPYYDFCSSCTYYPMCRRLRKCPERFTCNEEQMALTNAELKLIVLQEYKKLRSRETGTAD